jgi:hypothetical protein
MDRVTTIKGHAVTWRDAFDLGCGPLWSFRIKGDDWTITGAVNPTSDGWVEIWRTGGECEKFWMLAEDITKTLTSLVPSPPIVGVGTALTSGSRSQDRRFAAQGLTKCPVCGDWSKGECKHAGNAR